MLTRQRLRAARASERVDLRRGSPKESDYARVCKMFPALVHNNGLCQAVAFAQAKCQDKDNGKGKEEYGQYLDDLAFIVGIDKKSLLGRSRSDNVTAYQHLSVEVLSAASWMKRYAEALLESKTDAEPHTSSSKGGDTGGSDEKGPA